MKPKLSKSAETLRAQINEVFPERDRASDGWIADARHAARKSDHNPDDEGWVRAIDIDRDLHGKAKPDVMADLLEQLRRDKASRARIAYIIFNGRIASGKFTWRWRKYSGANPHNHHAHISFNKSADHDDSKFNIPMLGESK